MEKCTERNSRLREDHVGWSCGRERRDEVDVPVAIVVVVVVVTDTNKKLLVSCP